MEEMTFWQKCIVDGELIMFVGLMLFFVLFIGAIVSLAIYQDFKQQDINRENYKYCMDKCGQLYKDASLLSCLNQCNSLIMKGGNANNGTK